MCASARQVADIVRMGAARRDNDPRRFAYLRRGPCDRRAVSHSHQVIRTSAHERLHTSVSSVACRGHDTPTLSVKHVARYPPYRTCCTRGHLMICGY